MRSPTIPVGRRNLKQRLLVRSSRLWLREPALRSIPCDRLREPGVTTLNLLVTPAISFDLVELPTPTIRGTLFRARKKAGSVDEEISPRVQQRLFEELETELPLPRDRPVSIDFLYECLYPATGDESDVVPGFEILFPYQRVGVQFLVERREALLADDMGLGKTAQSSVAILLKQERISRALLICPRSIILQWQAEAEKFGGLRAKIVDGPKTERKLIWKYQSGLLLTTPQIVNNDSELLKQEIFDLVVCDDVSMLKNPGQITSSVRDLRRHRSWCLTGTPLENKPEDLLNTFEFVCPGLFSARERHRAPSKATIDSRIAPYFLRRRKVDHLVDLPEKLYVGPIITELQGVQLKTYQEAEQAKWEALQESGIEITKIHIFSIINALMRLCNLHGPSGSSAKAELLEEELDTILGSGQTNKAIVFAHDLEALRFLQDKFAKYAPVFYHGGLSQNQRQEVLSKFQHSSDLLLGSVKACDRGLNLQHASYVFHFDRTWNPVNELQAEDRCWRQGQKKTVFVYRYLVRGTIEERIAQVLSEKRALFDTYIDSKSMTPDEIEVALTEKLSLEDFLRIIRPPDCSESLF